MFKKCAIETLTDVFLIVFGADLIYLWFVGGWYDPYPVIWVSELVLCAGAIVLGFYRIISFLRRLQ